jgi:hypothetical protein
MLIVYHKRYGVDSDYREFRSKEEFEDWFKRTLEINPETEIIKIIDTEDKNIEGL